MDEVIKGSKTRDEARERAEAETGWFRTESGVIMQMDLPLPEGIAQRVARSEIVRVAGPDGGAWTEPGDPGTPDPLAVALAEARDEAAEAWAQVQARDEQIAQLQAELEAARAESEAAKPGKSTRK